MFQRWSTADARPREQFSRWRELICEAFLALTPESDVRDGFIGTVAQRPLGELSLARIDAQRQQVRRTDDDIARAAEFGYYANFQLKGTSLMTQHGRSTVLHPGDLAIVDTAEPFAFDFRDDFRQLSLFVPRRLLDDQVGTPVSGAARLTATRVQTATGVGASIRHALGTLLSDDLTPPTADRLAVHTAGIIAVALESGAAARAEAMARRTGSGSADRRHRLHAAALADIEEHLADETLSPTATARRLNVSVRLLYTAFAGRERSYAAELRHRRLVLAHRELQDPARAHLRIIDVAVAAGFADVAGFHRAFRREFGRTPGQVRASRSDSAC